MKQFLKTKIVEPVTPDRPVESLWDLLKGPVQKNSDGAPMANDVETVFGPESVRLKRAKGVKQG